MNRTVYFIIILFACINTFATDHIPYNYSPKPHPRLLWSKGEEKIIRQQISHDDNWRKIHQEIMAQSDSLLTVTTNKRIMTGKRLLPISRENLKRIVYLSYAYRITGEKKYAHRAEQEMLTAAAFSDWNPSHFLDVAEMTTAIAIGYDWLFNYLSTESKRIISNAIIEKGLNPSFDKHYTWWLSSSFNWNQVCNAGLTLGALAVYEKNTKQSKEIVNRAIETVKIPMQNYAPDGAYPEGITYWNYGTTFNIFLINALEVAFKQDFGLASLPGFMSSGIYSQQMITPSLKHYNYGDCKSDICFNPAAFWFYAKTKDPSLLYMQSRIVDTSETLIHLETSRFMPFALIWGARTGDSLKNPPVPQNLTWQGGGINPVAIMRSSWNDPNAAYLGFKGGADNISHGHQDVGSFFYEADGINWATELGQEDYTRLESKGLRLFGNQRFDVFRYNCFNHNHFTINNKPHVSGVSVSLSPIQVKDNNSMECSADISNLFKGLLAKSLRRVSLLPNRTAIIEDELTTLNQYTKLEWKMVTAAERIDIVSSKELLLTAADKQLRFVVDCPTPIEFKVKPAESDNSYDSPNPGRQIISLITELPLKSTLKIRISLIP